MSRLFYLLRFFIGSGYILLAMNVCAQQNITVKGDTLIVGNEAKFWINQEISFGSGTMPDKAYSYIYEAPNSLQKLIKNRKRKLLSPGYNGYKSKIVKFEKEVGHNSKDYNFSILVLEMPDGRKYWCDAANAFNNHEIILKTENNTAQKLPDAQKPSSPSKPASSPKQTKTSKPKPKPISVF
ncbi:MAG: hypothetical protein ABI863_13325 [Ginsengibacter sp.]